MAEAFVYDEIRDKLRNEGMADPAIENVIEQVKTIERIVAARWPNVEGARQVFQDMNSRVNEWFTAFAAAVNSLPQVPEEELELVQLAGLPPTNHEPYHIQSFPAPEAGKQFATWLLDELSIGYVLTSSTSLHDGTSGVSPSIMAVSEYNPAKAQRLIPNPPKG